MKNKFYIIAMIILGASSNFKIKGQSCPAMTITASPPAICAGQSSTLSVIWLSGSQFTWTPGNSNSSQIVVTPSVTSTYTLTGKRGNCFKTQTITLVVNPLPVINVNSGAICMGQSFTMVPSGAGTYTFTGGSAIVSPTVNTSYSVTGTSTAGCVSASPAVSNVTVNSLPVVTVNSGTICSGESFTMIPSGANSYTFSGGAAIVSPSVTTSYSITGTSAQGCVSASPAIAYVTVYAVPDVTVNSGAICEGESFTLVPSGGITYTFSGGSAIVSPTTTSSYTVTGTDIMGCVSLPAISNVTVHALPLITVNSGAICSGDSFTIIPSGANTFTIEGGSAIVSPTATTSYSVSGTSTEGCVSAAPAVSNVTVNQLPVITVNSGTICAGNSFTIIPSGASTYTFPAGSAVVSPTVTTTYSVTGASSEGCLSAFPAISTVVVNAVPAVNAGPDQTVYYGYGQQQCTILSASVSGASGPYQYWWNNGGQSQTVTVCPTVTTIYTTTVSANGCSGSDQVTVYVIDVSCENNKVVVCHNNHTICIAPQAVAAHLAHGDNLGACTSQQKNITVYTNGESADILTKEILLYPNPNTGSFNIELQEEDISTGKRIEIRNYTGQVIYDREYPGGASGNIRIELDKEIPAGIYFIYMSKATELHVGKMILVK